MSTSEKTDHFIDGDDVLKNRLGLTDQPELKPTPYLEKILHQVETDIKTGENISPVFDSVDDIFRRLEQSS